MPFLWIVYFFIVQDVDVTDNPVLLHCELGTTVGLRASLFKHGQLEDISFTVMSEEDLWAEFIHARIQCSLEVICASDVKSVKNSMQNLRKQVRYIFLFCLYLRQFYKYFFFIVGFGQNRV